jgi:tetratricopeptide (TPR) repeat protein
LNNLLELVGERADFGFKAMNWNWQFAFNIFWLIIVAGFVGWLFIRAFRHSVSPGLLIFKWGMTAPIVYILARKIGPMIPQGDFNTVAGMLLGAACIGIIALIWRGSLIESVVNPFTAIIDGGNEEPDKKPFYSIANAKRKRGRYQEAIAATRQQLEKFPDDFEGVMLVAGIQAEDLKDLAAAENTLNKFCERPKSAENQIAAAWTAMADWHLKFGVDVDSARVSLQKIIEKFPETELALRAEQRLAHLGGVEKIILGQHDRQRTILPEGVDNIGLLPSSKFLIPEEIHPGKLAAAHVKHLEQHPHDTDVREKLAVLYAEHFHRLDLATIELEQLIAEPRHTTKQVAHWLNLLANLQINGGATIEMVRTTLEQIVERFPDLPVANIARNRLARIELEFKGKKEMTAPVKIGVYEQDIGLKYGVPKKSEGV